MYGYVFEVLFYFLKDIIYSFFREEKGGKKRGRETLKCERYISWLPLSRPQLGTWPAA